MCWKGGVGKCVCASMQAISLAPGRLQWYIKFKHGPWIPLLGINSHFLPYCWWKPERRNVSYHSNIVAFINVSTFPCTVKSNYSCRSTLSHNCTALLVPMYKHEGGSMYWLEFVQLCFDWWWCSPFSLLVRDLFLVEVLHHRAAKLSKHSINSVSLSVVWASSCTSCNPFILFSFCVKAQSKDCGEGTEHLHGVHAGLIRRLAGLYGRDSLTLIIYSTCSMISIRHVAFSQ